MGPSVEALQERHADEPLFEFLLNAQRPLRIFELSSIARPRRWAEAVTRGPPALAKLDSMGIVKRVSGVEEADLCYWDAHESDDLSEWLEVVLELCLEFKVPLMHTRGTSSTIKQLAPSCTKASAEAAGLKLERLGGQTISVGKLHGCMEGLDWDREISSREVLLISTDLGDIAEAADHDVDTLFLLGSHAKSQLSAFREARSQQKAAERRQMSVSQRVAEDSPGLLAASTNPFFSVFKLPSLLAEVTRKNAENKARHPSSPLHVPGKPAGQDSPTVTGLPPKESMPQLPDLDFLELLEQWCNVAKVPLPTSIYEPPLSWDANESEVDKEAGLGNSIRGGPLIMDNNCLHDEAQAMQVRSRRRRVDESAPSLQMNAKVESESIDDIMSQLLKK